MKSARMQKKAGNNVMGMIRAAGLGYEYLRYEEEGQEPEVTKAIEDVSLEIQKGQFIAVLGHVRPGSPGLPGRESHHYQRRSVGGDPRLAR